MKQHSLAVDFSCLDFEKIDTEILKDEAKEQEEIEFGAMKKDPLRTRLLKEKMSTNLLPLLHDFFPFYYYYYYLRTMDSPFVLGFFNKHWLPPCFEAFILDNSFLTYYFAHAITCCLSSQI